MNEVQQLQTKLKGLIDARNYLLNQQPTDMVAVHDVSEKIVALSARLTSLIGGPPLPQLSAAVVNALAAAVSKLQKSVTASAAATAILQDATALANA